MKKIILSLVCVLLFNTAFCEEEFGTVANKPNPPENIIFVNVKKASKDKKYKILRDGQCLTLLDVVNTVGEFGALMKVKDASAAPYITKGDRVYLYTENGKGCIEETKNNTNKQETEIEIKIASPSKPVQNEPKKDSQSPISQLNDTPPSEIQTTSNNQQPASIQSTQQQNSSSSPFESLDSNNNTPIVDSQQAIQSSKPPMQLAQATEQTQLPSSNKISSLDWDEIIFDDQNKENVKLIPDNSWEVSNNVDESYRSKSLIAPIAGETKKAVWLCSIPEEGTYNISLWWSQSSKGKLSANLPVIIHSSTGDINIKVDQSRNSKKFNSIGDFKFKAGENIPIITLTNEGSTDSNSYICFDAIKIAHKSAN